MQHHPDIALYIGGAWRSGEGRDSEAVLDLATERSLASVPHASGPDLDDALASASGVASGLPAAGFFYAPTVLGEVLVAARVMNEVAFGSVAACRSFASTDEAVAEANLPGFGLAACVFTRSAEVASQVGARVEAGQVGLNSTTIALAETPSAGVKASGDGPEVGSEGVAGDLSTKYVVQAWESAV